MPTVKVKVKFKIAELLNSKFLSRADLTAIGETAVQQSKQSIAAGLSPVRGERRFKGYKNVEKYPGGLKPNRPVNLNLSGEMLNHLTFRVRPPTVVEYGIIGASEEVLIRAKAHNDGPTNDRFAQRAFVPDKPGQTFTVSIINKLRDIYSKALGAMIDKSNR